MMEFIGQITIVRVDLSPTISISDINSQTIHISSTIAIQMYNLGNLNRGIRMIDQQDIGNPDSQTTHSLIKGVVVGVVVETTNKTMDEDKFWVISFFCQMVKGKEKKKGKGFSTSSFPHQNFYYNISIGNIFKFYFPIL